MHAVIRAVKEEITENLKMLEDVIVRGNVVDFLDYKFVTGQIRGLRAVDAFLDDLAKRMDENE